MSIDSLCRLIEKNAERLRHPRGRRLSLEGVEFRVLQSDRNTVYRVNDGMRWYLKMPRSADGEAIGREILGATAAASSLGGLAGCRLPTFRGSVPYGYTLTAEVCGLPLHRALYRSIVPFPGVRKRLLQSFWNLGRMVGRLHDSRPECQITTTRPLLESVSGVVRSAECPDQICGDVHSLALSHGELGTTDAFTHGNLTLGNALAAEGEATLIDFECCGYGSRYDDLSLVCGDLVYCTAAVHLPADVLRRACGEFLRGYRGQREFDPCLLATAVVLRVGQKYAYGYCSRRGRATVGGVPLSRGRVRRLAETLLEEAPGDVCRRLGLGPG